MISLLVGILMVVASAAGFGLALFGRRPVPQPAMTAPAPHSSGVLTEPPPSFDDASAADLGGVLEGPWIRQLLARDATADHQPSRDVTLSAARRARSAALLALTVVGLAALVGGLLSVLAVGLVFLAT